jgi:DNA-binding MarR family transcriptional regulator
MWFSCLKHLPDEGITAGELEQQARCGTNLAGMQRRHYLVVEPEPVRQVVKPGTTVRPTAHGRRARATWAGVIPEVDDRWAARFPPPAALREPLHQLDAQVGAGLPDYLPILGAGLWNQVPRTEQGVGTPDPCLGSLLARPLLALALEFEHASPVSLAVASGPLRVLDVTGVPVRELPARTGVCAEGLSAAMGVLEQQGLAEIRTEPGGGRSKLARLTEIGERARAGTARLLRGIEARWAAEYGTDKLRARLAGIVGTGSPTDSPLAGGLAPHPGGRRDRVTPAETLPHFPFVLHRGGFPDGS